MKNKLPRWYLQGRDKLQVTYYSVQSYFAENLLFLIYTPWTFLMRQKTSCSHRRSCIWPSAASAERFIELAGTNETKRATKLTLCWVSVSGAHKSFVANSRFSLLPLANIGFISLWPETTNKSSLRSLHFKNIDIFVLIDSIWYNLINYNLINYNLIKANYN